MWMAIGWQHIDNRKVKLTIQIRTIFAFSNFMKNWWGVMKKLLSFIVLALGLSLSIVGVSKEVVDRELVAKILLLGEPLGSSSGGTRYPGSTMITIRYDNMLYTCFIQNDSGTVRFTCDDPYE